MANQYPAEIVARRDVEDPSYWWDLIEEATKLVWKTGDFRTVTMPYHACPSGHEVQVSPLVHQMLERDFRWMDRVGPMHVGSNGVRLLGIFKPVVVAPPMAALRHYPDGETGPVNDDLATWRHMAFRVERENGRFAYMDWSGNREDMR